MDIFPLTKKLIMVGLIVNKFIIMNDIIYFRDDLPPYTIKRRKKCQSTDKSSPQLKVSVKRGPLARSGVTTPVAWEEFNLNPG